MFFEAVSPMLNQQKKQNCKKIWGENSVNASQEIHCELDSILNAHIVQVTACQKS